MDIKPINNENDYKEALQIIDSIFDAKPGTSQGDRLNALTALVESYEAKQFPTVLCR